MNTIAADTTPAACCVKRRFWRVEEISSGGTLQSSALCIAKFCVMSKATPR